ncbi:MAG: aldose 1-epimerase family protein [Hyphomicrobiales bacterium]
MQDAEIRDIQRHSALMRGLADIRLVQAIEGSGAGGRLLEVRTPTGLSFDIALDRGGDILRLAWKGSEIGWHSAVAGKTPWPTADAEEGLGFLRGFDGFLVTCGLDHHGVPTTSSADAFNYPLRERNHHPLHGRIYGQQAELVTRHIDWTAGEIVICLTVRQATVFGEVLELDRTITAGLKTPSLSLRDTVTNRGFRPTRHGILYHFNLGYPMLSPQARLLGASWPLVDRLDEANAQPADDHVEIVNVDTSPNDGVLGIRNTKIGLAMILRFDSQVLPCTALWRAFQSGVYALGIEPQTILSDNADDLLAAGASCTYNLAWEFLDQ